MRYNFLSLCSREELKEKYEDKISKELSGPTYEVLAKIMKVIINRRVTGPGDFLGYVYVTLEILT